MSCWPTLAFQFGPASDPGFQPRVVNAAHNLKKVWTLPVNQLNAQELLARETLIITREAVLWAEESLVSDPHGRAARSGRTRAPVMEQQVLEVVGLSSGQDPVVEHPTETETAADQPAPEEEPGPEDQA